MSDLSQGEIQCRALLKSVRKWIEQYPERLDMWCLTREARPGFFVGSIAGIGIAAASGVTLAVLHQRNQEELRNGHAQVTARIAAAFGVPAAELGSVLFVDRWPSEAQALWEDAQEIDNCEHRAVAAITAIDHYLSQ